MVQDRTSIRSPAMGGNQDVVKEEHGEHACVGGREEVW